MKNIFCFFVALIVLSFAIACGGDDSSSSSTTSQTEQKDDSGSAGASPDSKVPPSKRVDLENKGIGPVTHVEIPDEIDRKLAVEGKKIFDIQCVACHLPTETLIGPPPKGVLDIRTPEWVMNMIINPDEMLAKDPLAKELLEEFNNMPMTDQGITEEEARALLEYFRTL